MVFLRVKLEFLRRLQKVLKMLALSSLVRQKIVQASAYSVSSNLSNIPQINSAAHYAQSKEHPINIENYLLG